MDRRAKLLGLDAPEQKKIDTNFTIGWLDDDEPTTIDSSPVGPISGNSGNDDSTTENEKKRIVEGTAKLIASNQGD